MQVFPHEYRRVLEEQAKEGIEAPAPVEVKNSPFGAGHEGMTQEKPAEGVAVGLDGEITDLENEYKEDMINPLADEDPNRKEVRAILGLREAKIVKKIKNSLHMEVYMVKELLKRREQIMK